MKNSTKTKLRFEKVSIAKLSGIQMQQIVGGRSADEFNDKWVAPSISPNEMRDFPTDTTSLESYFCRF